MYKVVWAKNLVNLEQQLNEAAKEGWVVDKIASSGENIIVLMIQAK